MTTAPAPRIISETTRRKAAELVRLLNKRPETSSPEALRSLLESAAATLLIERGDIKLPIPPEPDEVRNARRYLDDFGVYVHGHEPKDFHVEWMYALADPRVSRLLIIAPPDHAKTTVCAIEYPGWAIGRNPNIHVGLISNTATQANRKSVAVRDTVAFSDHYHEVFPKIRPDFGKGWAESEWFVQRADPSDKDSTFKASGIFGPILGDRYDLLVFDDIMDQENSATAYQREKVRSWVELTAMTRITPGGKAVAVMTRWHEADISQYWMSLGWQVIHMPALIEPQEGGSPRALWEERYPLSTLLEMRAKAPLTFERVYQGRPTPQEGALVKESWWRWYDPNRLPEILDGATRVIQVLDTASKDKTVNDYSVIMTFALYEHNAYLVNISRDRWQYPQLKQNALVQFATYHPNAVLIESASSGIALFQELKQTTPLPVRDVVADRSKVARLSAVLDIIASGRVYLPGVPEEGRVLPFVPAFLQEIAEFPLGEFDDQVDCVSLGLQELYGIVGKAAPAPGFLHLGQNLSETRDRVLKRYREMAAS